MNQMHHHNQQNQNFLNKIAFLDSTQREQLIPPEALISQMPIQSHHILLDVGAGSGFFTIPMAECTSNKVYAIDPDSRMLSVIADKAKEKGLTNIELIQANIENLSIQNNSVDFAMASLILHEVSSLPKALSNIFEVLKIGGHLLCLEYEKDDLLTEGPPMSLRISSVELEKELSSMGFEIVKKTTVNAAIYTLLAVKQEVSCANARIVTFNIQTQSIFVMNILTFPVSWDSTSRLVYFRQKKYNNALEVLLMDYITTKEAAKNWGITDRMVVYHCSAGRIKGARKMGNTWLIPSDAEKPGDGRYKSVRAKDGENR